MIQVILYFFIYAFMGWSMEVICKLIETKRFINRGFLLGPICPIYGYGVLGIVFLIGKDHGDILSVFLKSILVCSILEYVTSYLMEKIFHARWWDYSRRKYNINGRICLETMIPFGLLGTFVTYLLHPFVKTMVTKINPTVQLVLAILFVLLYLIDNFIAYFVLNKIKNEIHHEKKDNTELIREEVIHWLDENSYLYKRVKESFPNFQIALKELKKELRAYKEKKSE